MIENFTNYGLFSVANMLGNFSVNITYSIFITLGLITAIPMSAGKKKKNNNFSLLKIIMIDFKLFIAALDIIFYKASFEGMKLSGIILITTGFVLLLFPNNWPCYLSQLFRWVYSN